MVSIIFLFCVCLCARSPPPPLPSPYDNRVHQRVLGQSGRVRAIGLPSPRTVGRDTRPVLQRTDQVRCTHPRMSRTVPRLVIGTCLALHMLLNASTYAHVHLLSLCCVCGGQLWLPRVHGCGRLWVVRGDVNLRRGHVGEPPGRHVPLRHMGL
jgi:hypothetical protein